MPAILKGDLPLDASCKPYRHGGPGPQGSKHNISVGARLKIYWPSLKTWFSGIITAVNPKGMYTFSYDDGDVRRVKLASLVWDYDKASEERCFKRQKTAENEVTEGDGVITAMSQSTSRITESLTAAMINRSIKREADGGQRRQQSGCAVKDMQPLQEEGNTALDTRTSHESDIDRPDGLPQSGKRQKLRPVTASGHLRVSDNAGGIGGALRRVRKPSSLVRDILGGNMMGAGGYEGFALGAANLLAPIVKEETPVATPYVPRDAEQVVVKRKHRSPHALKSGLKPLSPALPKNPSERRPNSEEAPTPTTASAEVPPQVTEAEHKDLSAVQPDVKDRSRVLASDNVTVELSPAASPQSSEDNMYVAINDELSVSVEGEVEVTVSKEESQMLPDPDQEVTSQDLNDGSKEWIQIKEESKAGIGIREESKVLPDAELELTTHDKVGLEGEGAKPVLGGGKRGGATEENEVLLDAELKATTHDKAGSEGGGAKAVMGGGRRGGASKRGRGRKGSRNWMRALGIEGSHGFRSLADVYGATGGELPGFARQRAGKGPGRGAHFGGSWAAEEMDKSSDRRKSVAGSGHTEAEGIPEPPSPALTRERQIERLPDLNVSLEDDGLHALATMVGEETELNGTLKKDGEARISDKDRSVGEAGAVGGSRAVEEESDELLAQTLLDLRGHNVFMGAPRSLKQAASLDRDESVPALQLPKVQGSVAGRSSASAQVWPSDQDLPNKEGGVSLEARAGIGGESRGYGGSQKVLRTAGLCPGIQQEVTLPKCNVSRAVSGYSIDVPSMDVPLNRSLSGESRGNMLAGEDMDMEARGQDIQDPDRGCMSGGRQLWSELTLHQFLPGCNREEKGPDTSLVGSRLFASAGNGYGEGGHNMRTAKAKLAAERTQGVGGSGLEGGAMSTGGRSCRPMFLPLKELLGESLYEARLPREATELLQDDVQLFEGDSSATESDTSAGPTPRSVGRAEIAWYAGADRSGSVPAGAVGGRSGSAKAKESEGMLKKKLASTGVLFRGTAGPKDQQAIVPHAGGVPREQSREVSCTRPEDIVLSHLQSDSRRQASAFRQVMRAGGLAAWLEKIGLKEHADFFETRGVTARRLVSIGQDDAKMMGLRVGSRVRLMTAILDLYQK